MSDTAVDSNPVCKYCGYGRHGVERCPRVAAIEYTEVYPPAIKRIEFHPPQPMVSAAGAIAGWPRPTFKVRLADDGNIEDADDDPRATRDKSNDAVPGWQTLDHEHGAMKHILRKIAQLGLSERRYGVPLARDLLTELGIGWEV